MANTLKISGDKSGLKQFNFKVSAACLKQFKKNCGDRKASVVARELIESFAKKSKIKSDKKKTKN